MEPKKSQHVHKFRRRSNRVAGSKVFFCTMPDCNFKIGVEFSLGKRNLCNRCGSESFIDEYSIRLAKPICPNCRVKKGSKRVVTTKVITKEIAADTLSDLRSRLFEVVDVVESEDDLL